MNVWLENSTSDPFFNFLRNHMCVMRNCFYFFVWVFSISHNRPAQMALPCKICVIPLLWLSIELQIDIFWFFFIATGNFLTINTTQAFNISVRLMRMSHRTERTGVRFRNAKCFCVTTVREDWFFPWLNFEKGRSILRPRTVLMLLSCLMKRGMCGIPVHQDETPHLSVRPHCAVRDGSYPYREGDCPIRVPWSGLCSDVA